MTSQRKLAIGVAVGAAVFLTMFLWQAGSMAWKNVALAVGGLTLIAVVAGVTFWMVERNDNRAGQENAARVRAAEVRDAMLGRGAR